MSMNFVLLNVRFTCPGAEIGNHKNSHAYQFHDPSSITVRNDNLHSKIFDFLICFGSLDFPT